jgi:hypothetical protein
MYANRNSLFMNNKMLHVVDVGCCGKGFTWIILLVLFYREGRGAVESELGKRIARPVESSADNPSQCIHHVMVSVGSDLFLFGGQTFETPPKCCSPQ